ncbi:MAG: sulfite reductase subunit alpha [Alphaproteobacteria bacterium]|nr:sulfite reductase subunit alpha [Alphaproteobacteria bacterium]
MAPVLPENAPFSPLQRAWLDGYLAALFGTIPTPSPTAAEAQQPPAPAAIEDFPWHDPALPLEERLALAAARPIEHRLMAAMGQLDCGQCGYLCQSYADAIASGDEKQLTRCVPGGKATSRALKELLAEAGNPALPSAPATEISTGNASAPDGPGEPFPARLIGAARLNRDGSDKDTRHVVLAGESGALSYDVGDSLGVVARNCPALVAAIIERLGAKPDTPVSSPDGIERPLTEALSRFCEIRRPSDQAIEVLSSRAHDLDESRILQAMAEGYPGIGPDDADLLDLLEGFPSARPPVSELVSALDPLQPRLYSIASSPKVARDEIHLTVAAVRYEKRGRRRTGVASTFLCDRTAPGEPVSVFIRPAENFRPAPPDRPMIMIGPGTGIAPFRAFLQERRAVGATGRNWLFFGNPRRATDFLFEDELAAWHRDGLLARLDTAFSRDQDHKIYVQHRMLEHAAELWAWLEDGAHLYVCGDALRMGRDVERGLAYILGKAGRMDAAAAKACLARLAAEGRYQKDVY